ncbi:MAG: 1-(5-phosphoribosyl)-5-[(5-phosphoribosylamino)methylideneamino] imidazole-4-carboxamide isomerase [Candidatus Symbiobacter sp.]|nr:1-(5-phosphoribosyl)-5-[(5-phosphoribosylamino)methylideneamino] imidazole-4-carboxamide isomerase [Candidatus Symbiobacter sp.]
MMQLYPAIDLKGGKIVRLRQGDLAQATEYVVDAKAVAREFALAGATTVHVVDLDKAFSQGEFIDAIPSPNIKAITEIKSDLDHAPHGRVKLQLGGGIRSLAAIEKWLNYGVDRVVLGTLAAMNPALVREACRQFPGQIALGLDARNGKVATEGWTHTTNINAEELATYYEDVGVAAIIYTDIERDGMLSGPNLAALAGLVARVKTPVIASGGVSSLQDLQNLRDQLPQLDGVISGRAIYEGKIDLKAAIHVLNAPPAAKAKKNA